MGTAYSADSPLWFTLWRGILTEAYYPTIDRPQMRDLELLLTDGTNFLDEEKRDLVPTVERIDPHALGYRVTSRRPGGGYSLTKEIISAPHLPCLLQHTRVHLEPGGPHPTSAYVLCAPHLEVGGWGNNGQVLEALGHTVLAAEKSGTWMALGATPGFRRASVGYVGASDGWTDLTNHRRLVNEFDLAPNGNVALTGEVPLSGRFEFTIGVAFGHSIQAALSTLYQSLSVPFIDQKKRFIRQWGRSLSRLAPVEHSPSTRGDFFHGSYSLLLAHEDKLFPGAFIASLSIPWGAENSDQDEGGYHLVWTRDMVQTATALLAAGNMETPTRALIYLATCQQPDGGFPQNFWLNGEPFWNGVQLDEVAFPILLACTLHREKALGGFDPLPMVTAAARYVIDHGPATDQDRWEELGGYSPATLAVMIASFVGAGGYLRERGEPATARFLEEYADFLECHLERWTVTQMGRLVPGIRRHFVRIQPMDREDPSGPEDLDGKSLRLRNLGGPEVSTFLASDIVDAGFLQLVRYGVRDPLNPLILDSIKVIDRTLKVDTPAGPCWRRFNHDGYGQADDGGPYTGVGTGRAWPLLTGERGHYELAAGRDARPLLRAMESLSTPTGLLPEQVWDAPDIPSAHQFFGKATESAVPLAWAHAEYLKLARSIADQRVFDWWPAVARRYVERVPAPAPREVWTFRRQPSSIPPGWPLRVIASNPFSLHWSRDDWSTVNDTPSTRNATGLNAVDLPPLSEAGAYQFTFHWSTPERWEGRNFEVRANASGPALPTSVPPALSPPA